MRKHGIVLLGIGLLGLGLLAARGIAAKDEGESPEKAQKPGKPEAALRLESSLQKASYAIGLNIGRNFKGQSIEVDLKALAKGLEDALTGTKPLLTDEEIGEVMQTFQEELAARQADRARVEGQKNKTVGDEFLAANKAKPGVKTLPSGLQYKVIAEGTGEKPTKSDTVTTHYRGTLIDGTEFDSSYSRGEPATFPVSGVIAGWTEALQLMPVGSKWQLFIPSDLAYGARGAGERIGPNETLIFEIELLSIDK